MPVNYFPAEFEVLRNYDKCIQCRACVPHCPQQLDIPNLLARVDNFVEKLKQNTL